jgi:ribose transport system ATP-binding protein
MNTTEQHSEGRDNRMAEEKAILQLEKISKAFPGVQALSDVSLGLKRGEVRGLVGENGAGKSTLIKIITGAYTRDSGSIRFDGNEIVKNSPIVSKSNGIFAVYQDVMVSPHLSVAENFFLGNQPMVGPFVNWRKMYRESQSFLDDLGIDVDVRRSLRELSLAESEMVTIAKAIWGKPKLVIFDEPTAVLTRNETELLFRIIRDLKDSGIAVIYISHNLEEVFEVCDTITVLKDGAEVGTYTNEELGDVERLIPLMVGRTIEQMYYKESVELGEELLRVDNLSGEKFEDINFSVRSGEIVGLFGLIGAGRTEVARAIFGVDSLEKGTITMRGKETKLRSPKDSLRNGLGYLPEDKRSQGIFPQQDIDFNINIINFDKVMKAGLIRYRKAHEQAWDFVDKLSIKISSIYQSIYELSGGNQQKVIIARWLCKNPDVLLFDEPTVGIDVGTKSEIYRLFAEISKQRKGIVLISSYLPELMGLSDRIFVISAGKLAAEVPKEDFSEEHLLRLAMKNVVSSAKFEEAG